MTQTVDHGQYGKTARRFHRRSAIAVATLDAAGLTSQEKKELDSEFGSGNYTATVYDRTKAKNGWPAVTIVNVTITKKTGSYEKGDTARVQFEDGEISKIE